MGAAVSCLRYTPRLRREALARCCSSRQICRAWAVLYCTMHMHSDQRRLFAVPDFPGNLAVFIPGKSGMKKSGNPRRPGNGSPGMNSVLLVHSPVLFLGRALCYYLSAFVSLACSIGCVAALLLINFSVFLVSGNLYVKLHQLAKCSHLH